MSWITSTPGSSIGKKFMMAATGGYLAGTEKGAVTTDHPAFGQAAADVGQKMDAVPVFDSVSAARAATGADCSMSFVPPAFATDAILEAVIRQNGRWAALGG